MTVSIDTARSSIACNKADCVFEGARLSSSANKICAKTGPSLTSKAPVCRSKIDSPVISAGKRSLVHCTRLKSKPRERASAEDKLVFPDPGTSSISKCPSDNKQIKAKSIACLRPKNTSEMASLIASIVFSLSCAILATLMTHSPHLTTLDPISFLYADSVSQVYVHISYL